MILNTDNWTDLHGISSKAFQNAISLTVTSIKSEPFRLVAC
jgi:hypothetical protein